MSERGTTSWRALWEETSAAVGSRAQARWLCEAASGSSGDEFVAELDSPATERMVAHLDAMLARWRGGEPLQYVLGSWSFRRLELMVDRRVLIPRPETEQVVEVALATLADRLRPLVVADLGTGSGAIGLSIAAELPVDAAVVWLTDVSADALHVARANLAGVGRTAANVRVVAGSWFAALPDELRGTLDLVVANPPYVATGDEELDAAVRDHEPALALFAGDDGLDAIREIVHEAPAWLRPGGALVLEIGHAQGADVRALLDAGPYDDVEIRGDLTGRDRIAVARTPVPPA
jgi:release factor glutamine methyltransferase